MSSIVIGILAVAIGLLFCLRGVVAMRIVIAVWGAFVGLNLGAGIVSALSGDGFLSTAYYAVAVTLAMASIGFAVGAAIMAAFGVTWNWVIITVGVVVGIVLAVAAVSMNLPAILLVVLGALGGATATVGGLMLLTSTIELEDFTRSTVTSTIGHDWWWYAIYLVLVIAGIVAQTRVLGRESQLQQQW